MPDYLVILRADPATFDGLSSEAFAALAARFEAWAGPLLAEGRFLAGSKLRTDGGRCLVRRADRLQVRDGPFGETKEMVGGYHVISADDYGHAVELCTRHPNVTELGGCLEIRELVPGA